MDFHATSIPSDLAYTPGASKLLDNAWIAKLEQLGYERAQNLAPWNSVASATRLPD